jgi:hypothetical protein
MVAQLERFMNVHSKLLEAFRERQPFLLLLSVSLLVGTFASDPLVKGFAIAAFGSFLSAVLVSLYLATRIPSKGGKLSLWREPIDRILGLTFLIQVLIGIGFLAMAGIGILVEASAIAVLPAPFMLAAFGIFGAGVWTEYESLPNDMPKSALLTAHKVAAIGLLVLLPPVALDKASSPWLLGEHIHRVVSGVLALPGLIWYAFLVVYLYTSAKIYPLAHARDQVEKAKEGHGPPAR